LLQLLLANARVGNHPFLPGVKTMVKTCRNPVKSVLTGFYHGFDRVLTPGKTGCLPTLAIGGLRTSIITSPHFGAFNPNHANSFFLHWDFFPFY
jgi:hypothetical protein